MKKYLIFVAIIAVLLSACSNNGGSTTSSLSDPFIGGNDGIMMTFEEDAPPESVFDGGEFPFSVVLKLKNEGEHMVEKENIRVKLSGIFPNAFGVVEADLIQSPEDDLEAMEKDSEGDIRDSNPVFVEFADLNYVEELTGNAEFTIRAELCYTYETDATANLCLRKDNLETDEGVCEVNENKELFTSGAPLHVTDFKENARSKNKVAFTFKIMRRGDGEIFQQGTLCDDSSRETEDKVWVEVNTGLRGLECLGLREGTATSGYITLFGDERSVTCVQESDTNIDFEKRTDIKLTYDYEDVESVNLIVKDSLD